MNETTITTLCWIAVAYMLITPIVMLICLIISIIRWNNNEFELPFLPQPLRRLNARILSFILRKPLGKRHRHEETITYKLVDTVHFNHLIG